VPSRQKERLMRRATIERALKKRLLLSNQGEEIAKPLVLELIRAGHFSEVKMLIYIYS